VKAIVLRSGKDSFLVGANIDFVQTIRFAKDAEDLSLDVGKRFARIAGSVKPVVACVHGAALGGGFELALACTATIATDDPTTLLGLPEVKLGLMPAANGLLRVAQRAGLPTAIDLGLSGRSLKPKKALTLGLVDEVVPRSIALESACSLALRLVTRPELRKALPGRRAWMRHRGSTVARLRADAQRLLLEKNPIGRAVLFRRARAAAAKETRGHYPATERMLDVLERWARKGFAPAAELESRLFGELVVSEASHRLVELFFATTAVKKDRGVEPDERASQARVVERIGVVGAGLMGAGIACVSVQAGLPVRMKDAEDVALGRGLKYVKDVLDERARRGSISIIERDQTFARLSGTVDYSGIGSADLVVEAVFEELTLKQAVIRDLDELVKDTCVIASNTSSLPITQIAAASSRPDRVLGMHYFSPVHRVPLLEVVRTKETDPRAVATAVAVGKRQGKTVIVVRDGTGFYTTRILAPYLNEATQLLTEGVPIDVIDRALVDWGFPTGPLHLLDDLGLDVAAHVTTVMASAFGERMRVPDALTALRLDDRKGRKNGRGFYLHGRVDDTVYQALRIKPHARPIPDELSLRCIIPLVNEALRCLDEGILRSPRDGDVGAIFGIGFPPFRGGPFRYVDILGAPEVLRRTRALEQRFGRRFEPAPLLLEMARKGKRFY
jgi:3-hydroxyacyl-CoA dehydrogenase/enoyl-CoA hydratase/3-hydroxybutyryl-CoA epimerase